MCTFLALSLNFNLFSGPWKGDGGVPGSLCPSPQGLSFCYLLFTIDLALLIGLLWVSSQAWLGIPTMTSKFNITVGSAELRTNLESSLMNFFFP